jgi:ankyrin repeat domain-containing protein 50
MSKDSEEAADLREEFSNYSSRFEIASFCEGITTPKIGKFIVSRDSAFMDLPNERRIMIYATHVDMCKYSHAEDQNFRTVGRTISNLVNVATRPDPEEGPPGNIVGTAVSSSMFDSTKATKRLTSGV